MRNCWSADPVAQSPKAGSRSSEPSRSLSPGPPQSLPPQPSLRWVGISSSSSSAAPGAASMPPQLRCSRHGASLRQWRKRRQNSAQRRKGKGAGQPGDESLRKCNRPIGTYCDRRSQAQTPEKGTATAPRRGANASDGQRHTSRAEPRGERARERRRRGEAGRASERAGGRAGGAGRQAAQPGRGSKAKT